jgi:hypothetical protein
MSIDPATKSTEAVLWEAVCRAHAETHHHRLADDPKGRLALKAWEPVFLSEAPAVSVVIPFSRRRK